MKYLQKRKKTNWMLIKGMTTVTSSLYSKIFNDKTIINTKNLHRSDSTQIFSGMTVIFVINILHDYSWVTTKAISSPIKCDSHDIHVDDKLLKIMINTNKSNPLWRFCAYCLIICSTLYYKKIWILTKKIQFLIIK